MRVRVIENIFDDAGRKGWQGWRGVSVREYGSADPMIAVCGDQRPIRVRATSGYLGGAVPVLSRRDQPQCPGPAVPV